MRFGAIVTSVSLFILSNTYAQKSYLEPEPAFNQSGKWSAYWGYNRAWFTSSDLHIRGTNFDIMIYDVKAKDRPQPFSFDDYFNITKITIPQNNYRVGYNFNNHWSLSMGLDHMKYVMVQDQIADVSGVVTADISPKYAGSYLNAPVKMTSDFLRFEHTNGLNYHSIDLEYNNKVVHLFKDKIGIYWQTGAGGFLVIPKSEVHVFGYGLDNRYHIAGYSFSVKTGPEIRFLKHFFIRSQVRTGWMYLPDILVSNNDPARASQQFGYLEWFIVAGGYFNLRW
jgi:hypothetical protein